MIYYAKQSFKKREKKGETESRLEGWKQGCDQSQADTLFGVCWYFGYFKTIQIERK